MTEQDEPVLSSALLEARARPAAPVLRLYTPYYEQLSCGHYDSAISKLDWRPEQGVEDRTDFVAKIRPPQAALVARECPGGNR